VLRCWLVGRNLTTKIKSNFLKLWHSKENYLNWNIFRYKKICKNAWNGSYSITFNSLFWEGESYNCRAGLVNCLFHVLSFFFYSAAFDMHLSVAILRVPEGLDYTGLINDLNCAPTAVSVNPASAVADTQRAASATDASTNIKPSTSSASGWPEGRTFDRQQSRESLHSQGRTIDWLSFNVVNIVIYHFSTLYCHWMV